MSDYPRSARAYWCVSTLVGAAAFSYATFAAVQFDRTSKVELIAFCALVSVASMFPIRIPGTQAVITPSDILVFLSGIHLGPAAATVVAAIDAFVASCKISKRWTSRLGGPAFASLSVFVSANLFEWTLSPERRAGPVDNARLLTALLTFACTHFLLNTLLITALQALKNDTPLFGLWLKRYSWAGLTYAASASAAGLSYLAIREQRFTALLAAGPIIAVIFSSCYFYFRQAEERSRADRQRLEAAEAQARQTELHLRELEKSEERFHSAFNHAAIGMALIALDGRCLQANHALCNILGYSEDEMRSRDLSSLTHYDDLAMSTRRIAQLLTGKPLESIEQRYIHKLGHTVWVLVSASVARDIEGLSPCFILQIQDITARRRAEERLEHALQDPLTELSNRALFMDYLRLAMSRVERHPDRLFAVLFLDFDRFKVINDSLGHLVGDQLLIAIARRLEGCVRPTDSLARLGGDEFTILVEDISAPRAAVDLAERIQNALAAPFKIGEHEVFISASIGIAPSNPSYRRPEEILRDADTAMYRAKSLGKAQYALFDTDMYARALRRLQLETDLRHAVAREEFSIVYQPIVSLRTAQLVGFEALIRWRHPSGVTIAPEEFIPVAEEIGCIGPIGEWVLENACRQMRDWQTQFSNQPPLTVSVNISGKQLAQPNLVSQVRRILEDTGLNPRRLRLEITESVVMENIDLASRILDQLRALGIQVSIDDFGTGYSSLSYLRRLSIDTLKIDRSFVAHMTEDEDSAEIVRAVVNLAKNLRMKVIAEGVETAGQLERLTQLDCDHAQGFLFSKPISAADAEHLVSKPREWRAFDYRGEISGADDDVPLMADLIM